MNKSNLSYWRDDFDRRAEAAAGLSYVTVEREHPPYGAPPIEYLIHADGVIEAFGLGTQSGRVRGYTGTSLIESYHIDNDIALRVLCDDT